MDGKSWRIMIFGDLSRPLTERERENLHLALPGRANSADEELNGKLRFRAEFGVMAESEGSAIGRGARQFASAFYRKVNQGESATILADVEITAARQSAECGAGEFPVATGASWTRA